SAPVIDYLRSLGVTAVELMPIQQFVNDQHLSDNGLRNYWGYNTLNFFAPDVRYSSSGTQGEQVREFKAMVKALHATGIEVILDVVYNHTGEGNHLGPTLSFRGIDNHSYYRLVPGTPRYYMDYTGCGNSLNLLHPRTLQLVMDSLRYWISEMHVDGFRFDLATTLTRGMHEGDRLSGFLDVIKQDPVISQVKLIAEPWDVGPDGYWVGRFPAPWSEWNGKYRDTVRRYWKGDDSQAAELASRLTGSSDLYKHNGRRPAASINFVTSHDGFTLRDLVSYNDKHNEANGEDNRDGDSHNNSWNCGVEGPTDDPTVNTLREQQQRNLLATLLLSQGVPMLLAGDERNRTQHGNNNAYCQDNEISWVDWHLDEVGQRLLRFTQRLIAIRRAHPALRRRNFFCGCMMSGNTSCDIEWLSPDGLEMSPGMWSDGNTRCLGLMLNGQVMNEQGEQGRPINDDIFLILFNAHYEPIPFILPDWPDDPEWEVLFDTAVPDGSRDCTSVTDVYEVQGRSLVLLRERMTSVAEQPKIAVEAVPSATAERIAAILEPDKAVSAASDTPTKPGRKGQPITPVTDE
ncbi:MAG: glycogen debranching protein GlgX, partial [Chloroflexales bacterium]|nr:glycogen debranching protein GlgX [Chloroflexales bacterium]